MNNANMDLGFPVYLVDDDEAVRMALQLVLQTSKITTYTFGDPTQFLSALPSLTPGCIVLDIRMPVISGLKLQQQLVNQQLTWPVIIISGHGDIEACRKSFKYGAIDYLSKPIDEQDLIDAVQKGFDLLEKHHMELAKRNESEALLNQLTRRERQVLEYITRGLSTKDCAGLLSLSPRTVETHRASIYTKLGTHSVVELAQIINESSNSQY